jgi:hypothetical protein
VALIIRHRRIEIRSAGSVGLDLDLGAACAGARTARAAWTAASGVFVVISMSASSTPASVTGWLTAVAVDASVGTVTTSAPASAGATTAVSSLPEA